MASLDRGKGKHTENFKNVETIETSKTIKQDGTRTEVNGLSSEKVDNADLVAEQAMEIGRTQLGQHSAEELGENQLGKQSIEEAEGQLGGRQSDKELGEGQLGRESSEELDKKQLGQQSAVELGEGRLAGHSAEDLDEKQQLGRQSSVELDKQLDQLSAIELGEEQLGRQSAEELCNKDEKVERSNDSLTSPEAIANLREVDDVTQRVKIALKYLRTAKNIKELLKIAVEDPDETSEESMLKDRRISDLILTTEQAVRLAEESEKTVELLEELRKILSTLQESLKALQEKIQDDKVTASRQIEAAIGDSVTQFDNHNVITAAPIALECIPSIAKPTANVSESENGSISCLPVSAHTFLQNFQDSVRERSQLYCCICCVTLCLFCTACCGKK